MRFSEISSQAENIRYIKLIFQRVLYQLNNEYKKDVKRYKNEKREAKQRARTRRLLRNRKGSLIGVKVPDRPKR